MCFTTKLHNHLSCSASFSMPRWAEGWLWISTMPYLWGNPFRPTGPEGTLAWVDTSGQLGMLVIPWPAVTWDVADRLKCAKLTFCFSLKCVSCGQMWQSSREGQMSWSSCSCSSTLHYLICLTVTSSTQCLLLYKCVKSWHPAECCMGRCPGGTLSAPITPIWHVLQHGDEWKTTHTHTVHTFINTCWHSWITEEMLLLSLHLLFFTSLEAVNWKDGPLLTRGPGILQNSCPWEWSVNLGIELHLMTALSSRFGCHHKKERK